MTNILSTDRSSPYKQYKHSGFSATILSSYVHPSGVGAHGISFDGFNVLSVNNNSYAYLHQGFSSTIISSYSCVTYTSITWDSMNALGTNYDNKKAVKYAGFSSTILSSFTHVGSGYVSGSTWTGSDFIMCDLNEGKHNRYTSFSSTLKDSWSIPNSSGRLGGASNDGTNAYAAIHGSYDKHYKMLGFTSTISSSYSSPSTDNFELEWETFPGATVRAWGGTWGG